MGFVRSAVIALVVIVTAFLTACSSGQAETAAPAAGAPAGRGGVAPAVPVEVGRSVRKSMPLTLSVIGTVEPLSTVDIRSQITGQLESVRFREGDEVKQGQVLFTLDPRPFEAAVKQAEANLQRDIAQAANARAQAQRFVDLQSRGIATREQLDTSRANAEALDATVNADRAALENARIQLQYATITSPLTGRTGALMAHTGSLVRANDTTALVVINQLSPISVGFAVPEAQLAALKRAMSQRTVAVAVAAPENAEAPTAGKVTFVDNAVDATTGTIRVKGTFGNADHRLWPGQFVNAILTLSTDADAIVVPSAAVQGGPNGPYVFVVNADQTAAMRSVEVRRTSGNETIIGSGLEPDETVIVDGHLRVVPGGKVAAQDSAGKTR